MCGILGCVYCKRCRKGLQDDVNECANSFIIRRGPDSLRKISIHHGDVTLDLVGSVLSMRPPLTPQPLGNDKGDLLLWNGEVFGGLTDKLSVNDTKLVLDKLSAAINATDVLDCVASIQGPWAFLYWQKSTGKVWFGRDVFGRRSLLWHLPTGTEDCFALCSAAQHCANNLPEDFWTEVPAYGLFCMTLSYYSMDKAFITFYPWVQAGTMYQGEVNHMIRQLSNHTCISMSVELDCHLTTPFPAMNKRLPSNVLSSSSHEQSSKIGINKNCVNTELSSDNDGVQQTDKCCHGDAGGISSGFNLIAAQLLDTLQNAVMKRVTLIPDAYKHCGMYCQSEQKKHKLGHSMAYNEATALSNARIAILFSGGVDSMVLAALVDRCVPSNEPVDLINVAFQQIKNDSDDCCNVPDRITALASLTELSQQRKWNLIMINVSSEELDAERNSTIRHLVHPLCTVLDDSIGCALWFASRGCGLLYPSMQPYQSNARCVLVGIGADEQLAGYARHRTKYSVYGWDGLIEEVEMDVKRISHRNLGRDDRCISDHGREARFPFLDENVVSFLQSLSMTDKVDFTLPRGKGEKHILRIVAHLLGCSASSWLPKRAIQFGSRIAKLEGNRKEAGSDICDRLQQKH